MKRHLDTRSINTRSIDVRLVSLVAAVAAFGPGCALLQKVPGASAAAGPALEFKRVMDEAGAKAKEKCGPIRNAEVAWPEERAMGGVTGVKRVAGAGAKVYLEGMTSEDPKALAEQVKASEKDPKQKVTLPDNEKNNLTAWVAVVGRNLAKYSARPDITWTFAVIENDTPNAFSAPGGYVVVTTALLKSMENEAQLAGVLAHEVAHVVHKHSLKRYRDSKATQCEVATTGAYVLKSAAQGVASMLPANFREAAQFADKFDDFDLDKAEGGFVKFIMDAVVAFIELTGNEQEDEFQADATALELVAFAGYDAGEYEKYLTSLGNSGGWLAKHPSTTDRVAKLKALREGELAPFATGKAKPDAGKYVGVLRTPGS